MVLRLPDSWSHWNLELLAFEKRGKSKYPENKGTKEGTNNKLTHMASTPNLNPGHIQWEASALTTISYLQ